MMHQKPGFSVIEFLISIMISAMLMTGALTIYQQISKGMIKMESLTQSDISGIIAKNRLSQDLQGLCTLWFADDNHEHKGPTEKTDTSQNQSSTAKKNSYLYAESKDKQFFILTFITSSTLQTYLNPKYQCARVVYRLKPATNMSQAGTDPQEQLFTLERKEDQTISNSFDIEKIQEGQFYTVAKNILSCTIEYGFINIAPDKRKDSLETPWTTTWVDHWGTSGSMKESSDYNPTLPDIVRVKMTVKEKTDKTSKMIEFYCILPQSKEVKFQSFAHKRHLVARQQNGANGPTVQS